MGCWRGHVRRRPCGRRRCGNLDLAPCSAERGREGAVRQRSSAAPADGGRQRPSAVDSAEPVMLGSLPFSVDAEFARDAHLTAQEPGDGLLLEEGWTFAWCGWQWDVLRQHGGLGLEAPQCRRGSLGGYGSSSVLDAAQDVHPLGTSSALLQFAEYPTADLDERTLSLQSVHHHSAKSALCFAISGDSSTRPTSKWTAASSPSNGTNWSTAHRWRRLSAPGCSRVP